MLTGAQEAILLYIGKHAQTDSPLPYAQIAEAAVCHPQTVKTAIPKLVRLGCIVANRTIEHGPTAKYRFALTPKGIRYIEALNRIDRLSELF